MDTFNAPGAGASLTGKHHFERFNPSVGITFQPNKILSTYADGFIYLNRYFDTKILKVNPGSGNVDVLKENLSVEAPTGYGLSHTTVLKLVHENLTQGKPPNVTIDDAINTIELIHALYLSSEEDRWVEMTEKPQSNLLGL